jgi:hypothetical protein
LRRKLRHRKIEHEDFMGRFMEELLNINSESLTRFLIRWHGEPDLPAAALPDHPEIPPPLRRWHQLASRWSSPIVDFNRPLPLDALELEDGKLVFWEENQGNWIWGIPATSTEDDPEVFDRPASPDESWQPTGERLSEFLLHAMVFEGLFANHSQTAQHLDEGQLARVLEILNPLHPLPLPRGRSVFDSRILVGNDLLVETSYSGRKLNERHFFDVIVATLNSQSLVPLKEIPNVRWK